MIRHKFAVGQVVDFEARSAPLPRPNGPYEVVRVLPVEDNRPRAYRIKSAAEPFERSAIEHEIVSVGSPATERAAIFGGAAVADREQSRWARTLTPSIPSRSRGSNFKTRLRSPA
jgi:hypothetical protein